MLFSERHEEWHTYGLTGQLFFQVVFPKCLYVNNFTTFFCLSLFIRIFVGVKTL